MQSYKWEVGLSISGSNIHVKGKNIFEIREYVLKKRNALKKIFFGEGNFYFDHFQNFHKNEGRHRYQDSWKGIRLRTDSYSHVLVTKTRSRSILIHRGLCVTSIVKHALSLWRGSLLLPPRAQLLLSLKQIP